jgi:acyl-CoA reductase-like NAD-dependent aldehyde dehydrogenase
MAKILCVLYPDPVDGYPKSYAVCQARSSRPNVDRAKARASRIETGSVWINTRSSTDPELPFGGIKRSGYGHELSEFGIKELVNQKMVVVATD